MIKVSVFYPQNATSKFDMAYYLDKHIPMARKLLGSALKGVAVEQGLAGAQPGVPPTYAVVAHLSFDSMGSFAAAFLPIAPQLQGDLPNYTNVEPLIQFGEVKL